MNVPVIRYIPATALALSISLAALSGCGKASEVVVESVTERALETEMGGEVDVDINSSDGTFTMKGGDGKTSVNIQAGESVQLPANLPADVPIPEGVTWQMVQAAEGENSGFILQGSTAAPMADLATTMKTKIAEQGWESVQNIAQSGAMEMMTYSKGEKMLTCNLATDNGTTTVMMALN